MSIDLKKKKDKHKKPKNKAIPSHMNIHTQHFLPCLTHFTFYTAVSYCL